MIFINQGGRIVYVNPQCTEMMGYTPEELLSGGFDFERLVAPESLPVVREAFGRHARGKDVPAYEYDLLTRQGERLTVINATKLISYRGRPAILGLITDISERNGPSRRSRRERILRRRAQQPAGHLLYVRPVRQARRWNRQAETILGIRGRTRSRR